MTAYLITSIRIGSYGNGFRVGSCFSYKRIGVISIKAEGAAACGNSYPGSRPLIEFPIEIMRSNAATTAVTARNLHIESAADGGINGSSRIG